MKYPLLQSKRTLGLCACLFLLTACQANLYSGVNETDANHMVAVLRRAHISADKVYEKSDNFSVKVDKSRFVDAVELLRQNGLPRRRAATVIDVFPGNQLVTSPMQEQARLTFLKEQRLQQMLGSMEGVVDSEVTIAEPPAFSASGELASPPPSVAVYLKYNPENNLPARENEIRELLRSSLAGVPVDRISVYFEAASWFEQDASSTKPSVIERAKWPPWLFVALLIAVGACACGVLLASASRLRTWLHSLWKRERP